MAYSTDGMRGLFFILDDNKQVKEVTRQEWQDWMLINNDKRQVYSTSFYGLTISTVFLTMNHNFFDFNQNPILFETIIFNESGATDPIRYETYEQAEKGHWLQVGRAMMHILTKEELE